MKRRLLTLATLVSTLIVLAQTAHAATAVEYALMLVAAHVPH